jgi:dihydroorotase
MKLDVLIKNGHVIDTTQNIDEIRDIGIEGGKIIDIANETLDAEKIVNAKGCYVFPGLIDFHTHLFHTGSGLAVRPELVLSTGVTAAVDAGTSGCSNYEAFYKSVILNTSVKIKSFVNVYSGGQLDFNMIEDYNPKLFNEKSIRRLKEKYKNEILGLKIRIGKEVVGDLGIEPLQSTIELAERIGDLAVCVHTTNSPCKASEIVKMLRKGDIYCHAYNGRENNIIDENGKVYEEIKKARERGVIFDVANGRNNYCHDVAVAAIKDNFLPDIISSDITSGKYNYGNYARSLTFIMSKYVTMNIDMKEIIKAVTETPAKVMGMENQIGTLKAGAYGDVSIFKLIDQDVIHKDYKSEIFMGNKLLIPQMTLSNGEIVYCQENFNL